MSLYEGLLDDEDKLVASDGVDRTSFDMLRSQLRARSKRVASSVGAAQPSSRPAAFDCSRKRRARSPKAAAARVMDMANAFRPFTANEYDPLVPNDYDEEYKKRRKQEKRDHDDDDDDKGPLTGADFRRKEISQTNDVATRIMAKMGYRQGQGLGRQNQGISESLVVEKTSRVGGKIVQQKRQTPIASKVILLRNMVGKGEVDPELESETKDECEKYGEVRKVVIFEIPDSAGEDAVRIFVEFERINAARNAVADLNGRFFGGRPVKASFYNLDKFRQYMLADAVP